jgi:hypothetical protein
MTMMMTPGRRRQKQQFIPLAQPLTMTKLEMPELSSDFARYDWMLQQHQRICAPRPYINVVTVARNVGCKAFGVDCDVLLAAQDAEHVEVRQKIMAFAHFATRASFTKIGRAFGLDYTCALRSFERYKSTIEAAVGLR